jgi:UDP-perosamine 4-acetyltransferase
LKKEGQKPVVLLGAGGHARVLIEALRACHRNIMGVLTPEYDTGTVFQGLVVLGGDERSEELDPGEVELVNGIGSLPGIGLRWRVREKYLQKGFSFSTVVHPGAVLAEDIRLEAGTQVMAGCIVQPGVRIGADTILNTGVVIDHDCRIGKCCHIAPGCTLSGGVNLGRDVHLGTGTTVIQNISIGNGAVIGAGSVIFKDIPAEAKIIQSRKTRNYK